MNILQVRMAQNSFVLEKIWKLFTVAFLYITDPVQLTNVQRILFLQWGACNFN